MSGVFGVNNWIFSKFWGFHGAVAEEPFFSGLRQLNLWGWWAGQEVVRLVSRSGSCEAGELVRKLWNWQSATAGVETAVYSRAWELTGLSLGRLTAWGHPFCYHHFDVLSGSSQLVSSDLVLLCRSLSVLSSCVFREMRLIAYVPYGMIQSFFHLMQCKF
jgi:hypothetical protein